MINIKKLNIKLIINHNNIINKYKLIKIILDKIKIVRDLNNKNAKLKKDKILNKVTQYNYLIKKNFYINNNIIANMIEFRKEINRYLYYFLY